MSFIKKASCAFGSQRSTVICHKDEEGGCLFVCLFFVQKQILFLNKNFVKTKAKHIKMRQFGRHCSKGLVKPETRSAPKTTSRLFQRQRRKKLPFCFSKQQWLSSVYSLVWTNFPLEWKKFAQKIPGVRKVHTIAALFFFQQKLGKRVLGVTIIWTLGVSFLTFGRGPSLHDQENVAYPQQGFLEVMQWACSGVERYSPLHHHHPLCGWSSYLSGLTTDVASVESKL